MVGGTLRTECKFLHAILKEDGTRRPNEMSGAVGQHFIRRTLLSLRESGRTPTDKRYLCLSRMQSDFPQSFCLRPRTLDGNWPPSCTPNRFAEPWRGRKNYCAVLQGRAPKNWSVLRRHPKQIWFPFSVVSTASRKVAFPATASGRPYVAVSRQFTLCGAQEVSDGRRAGLQLDYPAGGSYASGLGLRPEPQIGAYDSAQSGKSPGSFFLVPPQGVASPRTFLPENVGDESTLPGRRMDPARLRDASPP